MAKAPDFNLIDQNGKSHSLIDYRGKWLVLYFYPKDNTPGCTAEACSFRDGRSEIESLGVEVVGISRDSVESHKKFSEKYHLDFTLLSDPDHEVISAYGAWKKLRFLGKSYMGIERNTFIINPDGEIVKEFIGVDPKHHFDEIVNELRTLIA